MFRLRRKPPPQDAVPEPDMTPAAMPERGDAPSADRLCPGAPLFDAQWYRGERAITDAEAWDHYLAEGSRRARSPAPLFSPAWYREAYPDVALAGIEPLVHYRTHGWREGRDPSPVASTRLLEDRLARQLEDGTSDPLSVALQDAPGARAQWHPAIPPFDPRHRDVAIVMVYRQDRAALDLAIWALAADDIRVPRTLYLIDDGEPATRADLDRLTEQITAPGLQIRRLSEPDTDGEIGLVNAGLWAALQAPRHSHVLLLEQSTILPEGLVEGLLELWAPVAVPVMNLAGTAQSVPIGFDIYKSSNPLDTLSAHVAERQAMIPGAVHEVDQIEPACALFMAGALEVAGLLDVRAKDLRGAVDATLRTLTDRGLAGASVARHLYAHRLERSPLVRSRVASSAGEGVAERLDRTTDPGLPRDAALVSAGADRRAIKMWTGRSQQLLDAHGARCRRMWSGEAREQELVVTFGDATAPPNASEAPLYRSAYRSVQRKLWRELVDRDRSTFRDVLAVQPLAVALGSLFEDGPPCLVLTMDTDPVTGDERDGYVQRVIAIDHVLAERSRIYLKIVESRHGRPVLRRLRQGIWRLEIAHRCDVGEAILSATIALGAPVYSHSLVGIDPPVVRKLLPERRGPFLMDMHGAVPEEFVLYDDHFMAQKYAAYETWAARHSDAIVCVTDAMADHLGSKLGLPAERMLACPIFLHETGERPVLRGYNDRPRAIYAGGTQRWQRIPDLAALVAETQTAVDWVLLTPDVSAMKTALEAAGADADAGGTGVRAAAQNEVFTCYRACDFGLLLREASVVNRVACPTKLIEYLRYGVIPVLDFAEIGDFLDHGMQFVTVDAFRAGDLPSIGERASMAQSNRAVLETFGDRVREGQCRISHAVFGRPVGGSLAAFPELREVSA